ncbi:MAG: uncharacterized protein QOC96_722 [Acidobacteriota bacterium]|jgi:uncharacterized protein YggE|nr:uncharacterized protein [Acidobacteriota bacterium]
MNPQKLLVLIVLSIFLTGTLRAADNPPPRTITVGGQAEIHVVPDEVVFRLEAESIDRDLNAAKTANDESVKKVFALARSYQIAPQNVQSDYISVQKRYEEIVGKRREFTGYAVSQTIVILLTDISRFENLFSDLIKIGITDVSDVTFRVSQMRKYMDQARSLALKAAREKAIAMAGELGQKVGKPDNITEVGMSVSSAYGENYNRYPSNANNISTDLSNGVSDNEGTIAPGMISITARVKVSFELD